MRSDIEIAQQSTAKHIVDIAAELNLTEDDLCLYGRYKAKLEDSVWSRTKDKKNGKLILVTAINPTPAGEGKTTTTVGLGQGMKYIGKKAIIALREPSLGPVMGVKGGAAGGGYSQVIPMEDINLHFTGDMHAITAANNLLSALIDNHIYHGNALNIDLRTIAHKRVMDMNDRSLREVVVGLGRAVNGYPRQDGFMITVASEVMAILCLSEDLENLKERLGKIIIGYDNNRKPVTAKMLKAEGAMALLLKDAIKPNLVQTLENSPALIHGGPFANIAHGCNSVRATKLGLKLADYCITEAGFGADLGAEKFFDIKCRAAGLNPSAVVIVATVRALKYNGGVARDMLSKEDAAAVAAGGVNLQKHIENIKKFGIPAVVALNLFGSDTQAEIDAVENICKSMGVRMIISEVFSKGGLGGAALAEEVVRLTEGDSQAYKPLYDVKLPIKTKIETIVKEIYGGSGVVYTTPADNEIKRLSELGYGQLPVCMAKTQYSLSDNPKLLGRPEGFEVTVRDVRISAGAGFVVVLTGDVLTMPGLPAAPASDKIDISPSGEIVGLF